MPFIMSTSTGTDTSQHEQVSLSSGSVASIPPNLHPKQLSVSLPLTPHTTMHMQVMALQTSSMVFLTTTDPSNSSSLSALGSFVYSMPNVCLL